MKQDTADDIERDAQWSTVSTTCAPTEPEAHGLSEQWHHPAHSAYMKKSSQQLSIRADDAALDETCRAAVSKLIAAGCTRANHPYFIEQFQVTEQDIRHLQKHGCVHAPESALLRPVIRSYEKQKTGADVGKIMIVLNVNLY